MYDSGLGFGPPDPSHLIQQSYQSMLYNYVDPEYALNNELINPDVHEHELYLTDLNAQANSLGLNLHKFLNGNQKFLSLDSTADKYLSPQEPFNTPNHRQQQHQHQQHQHQHQHHEQMYQPRPEPSYHTAPAPNNPYPYYSSGAYAEVPQQQHQQQQAFSVSEPVDNIKDCFNMSSLALPDYIQEERFIQRRHSGTFQRTPHQEQRPTFGSYDNQRNFGGDRVRQMSESSGSSYGYGFQATSSSNLFGLTDISTRLEQLGSNSGWQPLCSTLSSGGVEPPSTSPSPSSMKMNPIEEFVFLSDDEDTQKPKMFGMGVRVQHRSHQDRSFEAEVPPEIPLPAAAPVLPVPMVSTRTTAEQSFAPPAAPRVLNRATSWSQVVRTAAAPCAPKPVSVAATQTARSPPKSLSPSPPPTRVVSPNMEFHRGPKVDPRWPVDQQVFLGPIPVAVTWDEIRNTFYSKVARQQILHTYVQSKPVNDVVYGQIVFDKASLAAKILKEGPIKVSGQFISVTAMKDKAKVERRK